MKKARTESSAGGGKAHGGLVMAPVGAAGTLLRPGAQAGSSPVGESVRKAEAGALTREDRPRTLSQRAPVPQNTGWHTAHDASLKSGALGTLRDSSPRGGLPASTWRSQGGSPQSRAAAAPNPPCPGKGCSRGSRQPPRHSGGTPLCQVLCLAGRRRGLTQSLGFPEAETPGDGGAGAGAGQETGRPGNATTCPPRLPRPSAWKHACPHLGPQQWEAEPTCRALGSLMTMGGEWRLSKHN